MASQPKTPAAPPSIFAGVSPESGYTYEQEQALIKWFDQPGPDTLREVERLIPDRDRHVNALQWAKDRAERQARPDGGVDHGPNPDAGNTDHGQGRNRRPGQ